ncbi:Clp protease-domain-containing protein [Apiospora arundinis]
MNQLRSGSLRITMANNNVHGTLGRFTEDSEENPVRGIAYMTSIADLNGPDLPEISNEQACATTTQYTAPFIPSAAPNNHYTLPEETIESSGSQDALLFNSQCSQNQHPLVLWPQSFRIYLRSFFKRFFINFE